MTQLSILFSLLLLGAATAIEAPTEPETSPESTPPPPTADVSPAMEVTGTTNPPPETATKETETEEPLDLVEVVAEDTSDTNQVAGAIDADAELPEPETREPETPETPVVEPAPEPTPPSLTKEDWVEINRQSLAPTVDALSNRLSTLEQLLVTQHQDALAAGQEITRTILLVAGSFATAVLFGVLLGALILARAVQKTAGLVVAALPASRQLDVRPHLNPQLGSPDELSQTTAPMEQVTHRFLGAIEKLEKRVVELEHTSRETAQEHANGSHDSVLASGGNGGPLEFSVSALHQKQYGGIAPDEAGQPDPHDQAALWIGKGQALLNLGNSEEALDCFDKAAEAGPLHAADAYVKRGIALERMEKIEDAVESYDRAIAADQSMTLAYLYKGAACNRLQRYREALDCYEIALKCEQKLAEH